MPKNIVLLAVLCLSTGINAAAQLSVTLTPSLVSPQPVGTVITWTATLTGSSRPLYQFRVTSGSVTNMVRDQSGINTLAWTMLQEGTYTVSVKATDGNTNTAVQQQVSFTFTSRITGGTAVVSATAHPLVALYSAPPCAAGQIQVQFQPAGATSWTGTPPKGCQGGASVNFYLAGMLPNSTYRIQHLLTNASGTQTSPQLTFQTGSPPFTLPVFTLLDPPDSSTSSEKILMTSYINTSSIVSQQIGPVATTLSGNLLWYYPDLAGNQNGSYLVRPAGGGTFLVLIGQRYAGQILREIDLAGNLVRETNVPRLNTLLTNMGKSRINWLSHDALRLPNGHTLVLGTVERLLTDIQGPGAVDVLGDMILDLDQNFQLTWSWNAFDFLDQSRTAVLGESCQTGSACPPLNLASDANDWTHGNALCYLPDGNLLLSMRNQDWVIKIQYQNGTGPGTILWRLGPGGDFNLTNASGPFPWFSHQHSIYFDGQRYGLFDNGNTRIRQAGSGNSRGQAYTLDESGLTATQTLNADLGAYAYHWGSAQTLANGDFHFLVGDLNLPSPGANQSMEVLPSGAIDYTATMQSYGYRSFRLRDLYTYKP